MNTKLKSEFMAIMMRFRKAGMPAPPGENIRMGELFVLGRISENGVNLTEIQNHLFMTKSAVSQMLGALERRGLVRREIDPQDRRRITVTLTEDGKRFKRRKHQYVNQIMDMTISRFGEENMRELIRLLNLLADVFAQIREEVETQPVSNLEGDKPSD